MLVTIIADASYCPHTLVAGYGYRVSSDRGHESGGGVMTTRIIVDNTVAEMMAVANALHHAVISELVQCDDIVLLQTDCMSALQGFRSQRILNPQEVPVYRYVEKLVSMYNLDVRYKHVKGHSRNPGARYVANNHCDQTAKFHMRRLRDSIRDQKIES